MPPKALADPPETRLVAIGPGLAVARDAQHHEARVDPAQHVPPEAPAFQRAGLEILGQRVGLGDERWKNRRPLWRLEIEVTDFLLRASDSQTNVSPHSLTVPEPAARIADLGLLDLDHLGAELRHEVAQYGAAM